MSCKQWFSVTVQETPDTFLYFICLNTHDLTHKLKADMLTQVKNRRWRVCPGRMVHHLPVSIRFSKKLLSLEIMDIFSPPLALFRLPAEMLTLGEMSLFSGHLLPNQKN